MMGKCEAAKVSRVGIVGTGVIGSGWSVHFLAQGMDVIAFDPDPGAEDRLNRMIDDAWPLMERLGVKAGASRDRLTFTTRMEDAVAGVDVVQECTPEVLASKVEIFRKMDAATSRDTILLSSTSGISMTGIQSGCVHPERTVVGHPYNPVYLMPLVEVVGGDKTAPEATDWAADFYSTFGKHVIKMKKELPGFIAGRLQEAMWREMLHMVAEGEASVEEIDDAITYGPGLRWAIMGPGMTYHLGGGEKGMAHLLDQFGPALKWPWSRLVAPELTEELRQRLIAGCDRQADGRSVSELARERDDCLIGIMKVLKTARASRSGA